MFIVTTLTKDGHSQSFQFNLASWEAGLDFISNLAARQEIIFSVFVAHKDSLTPLPVAAFDGVLLSAGSQHLQAEWQTRLTKTPDRLVSTDPWIQQRLDQNAQRIVQYERLLTSIRCLLAGLTDLCSAEVCKHTLTQRYQTILAIYENQLTRTYAPQKRLSRLEQVAGR